LADTPDFDLAVSLALLLQGGAVTSLNPKGYGHDTSSLAL